jgi:NAD(P)-dependent dehydrogenase (short-subunit alcohol dehydrogenase family)
MAGASTLIVGGTSGLGLRLAQVSAAAGHEVVITGRDLERTQRIAASIDGGTVGAIHLDLAEPQQLAERLASLGPVRRLVLAAIERDHNTVHDYNIESAMRLATLKLVGYTEVVHVLAKRLTEDASILLFGGQAARRPYPGSTTVTTVNGAITSMVRTLAVELAPVRVNALHPGVVGDSPEWADKPEAVHHGLRARTPIGRLATMDDVADAALFLLENNAVNGVNLEVDGGWMLL